MSIARDRVRRVVSVIGLVAGMGITTIIIAVSGRVVVRGAVIRGADAKETPRDAWWLWGRGVGRVSSILCLKDAQPFSTNAPVVF